MQKIYHPVHWGPSHTVSRQKIQKTGSMPASGLLRDAVYNVLVPGGHSLNMHPWGVQGAQSRRNKSIWHPEWHGVATTASKAGAGWRRSTLGETGLERRLWRAGSWTLFRAGY